MASTAITFNQGICVKKQVAGFTLIELMMAVAIVGILGAIAYPMYTDSVRKSNRTDAITELNDIAIRLQRCYSMYSTYNPASGKCDLIDKLKLPAGVTTRGGLYVINGSDFDNLTYTITATPVAGKMQEKDLACDKFTLDQTGQKKAFSGSADATEKCW